MHGACGEERDYRAGHMLPFGLYGMSRASSSEKSTSWAWSLIRPALTALSSSEPLDLTLCCFAQGLASRMFCRLESGRLWARLVTSVQVFFSEGSVLLFGHFICLRTCVIPLLRSVGWFALCCPVFGSGRRNLRSWFFWKEGKSWIGRTLIFRQERFCCGLVGQSRRQMAVRSRTRLDS